MCQNSPNLHKSNSLHIQKVQQTLRRINAKRLTARHIIMETMAAKEQEKKKSWKQPKKPNSLRKRGSNKADT